MTSRHTKFAQYWEGLGRPKLEHKYQHCALFSTLHSGVKKWREDHDYRLAGDANWELVKEWVDSDFTLPIEYQSPSTGEWLPVDNPKNNKLKFRKVEK